jgi:adenylate cyclase
MRLSLKVKLSLLITSLVVLTVALVSYLLLRQQQQALTEQMIKRGDTIAEHLAAAGKSALVNNDDLTLNVLVKEAMNDRDVAYVAFVDDEGNVRAHSELGAIGRPLVRPAALKKLEDKVLVQSYREDGRALLDFSVPLIYSRVPVGSLYVGFSKETIAAALTTARNRATLITVGLVVIGVAGAVGLATMLSRPIFRLVQGTKAIAAGNFQIALPVTSRDELGTLTESFNQMARSLREKEMIKRAFTRYVAREVVEEVLKDPSQLMLTGERREVTVLFCDIRGFTPLAERLAPEQVVSLLNEFYTLMIETVFKHDGTLDKFLGDAVMAVFGAPIAHPDHAIRAVQTALDMRNGIAELNERRVGQGKLPIGIGIGLSLGEVVAGTVGTEDRMEYTVIGDSVNLAARLVDNARPAGRILISHRTYEAVRDLIQVKGLGPLKVKGKEEEVEVYEVLSLQVPA